MGRFASVDLERKAPSPRNTWPDWFGHDPRWLLVQRIIASPQFVRSRLLAKFLLYIVGETLEDRKENITEHKIGVHVFDRPTNYSSIEDNIVRNYARQLRRRLAEYFSSEGAAEPLHIDIPLGGYIPIFGPPSPSSGEKHPHSLPDAIRQRPSWLWDRISALLPTPVSLPSRSGFLKLFLLVAYSAALATLVWFVATRNADTRLDSTPAGPTAPLWSALFGGPANCYIVPADAGLNLLEDFSHRPMSLVDYINGAYLGLTLPNIDQHSATDLRDQHFTSFVDLQTVSALARLPQFNPQRDILRFARDLRLDDLKNANAVFVGAEGSDPWVSIAESNANFRIVSNTNMQSDTLINTHPLPGEAASYVSHWNEPAHETFSVISYLPNLSGSGHILLLQGLDVAGTQAAVEALLHPEVIAPILRKADLPNGTLRSFEILLRSTSIDSNATGTHVIGSRIY